ncbi:MAG: hypothetical protein KGI54_08950 [Pseudomonadota bacterium]|nr:hypothetical protein [Pseudomonadota bacterium]
MQLLELVQNFCLEVGIAAPTQVVTSQDVQINQVLAILNRAGHDLARDFEWQELDKEYIVTTVGSTLTGTTTAGSAIITGISSTTGLSTNYGITGTGIAPFAQIVSVDSSTQVTMNLKATATGTVSLYFGQIQYPLPSDWLKQIPQTEWDRSNRWPLLGPQSPQDWQSFKSGIVYAGPRERFRIQGNTLSINPPPPANLTFAFEYISSGWVVPVTGANKTKFTLDTDSFTYDDSLLLSCLRVKWLQTKGFEYGYAQAEYMDLLSKCKAQDKSAPLLSLAPATGSVLLTNRNVQDGNWNG